MELIGRRRELAAIEGLLDRSSRGSGAVLVVVGPRGSGKTALADAAIAAARSRGLPVTRTATGAAGPRLVVLDGIRAPIDHPDQLAADGAAVLITATDATEPHFRLAPLTKTELGRLLTGRPSAVVQAVWLVTGGLPGPALDLAATVGDDEDAIVTLALNTLPRLEFLVPDVALIRLLESAAAQSRPAGVRARLLIRLARELLYDPSAARRRRELVAEAVRLARGAGDAGTLAEVLDGRLHALWDPAAARDRLASASEIVELARQAGDTSAELRGLFWRFTALVELGDLEAAEAVLTTYARTAELAGDAQAAVVVLSRQAELALVRGRFDLAAALTAEVATAGRRAGLADTVRLTASLTGRLAMLRGEADQHIAPLQDLARRLPGQFFEATAARVMAEAGRNDEALLELDRLLPAVLAGIGPRWLGAVADLAFVAARSGDPASAQHLYDALTPYQGRLVVWGGANTIAGPVDEYLGRLAGRLGRSEQALAHLNQAVILEERLGALPWLATTLAIRDQPGDQERSRSIAARLGLAAVAAGDEWRLLREGTEWRLEAGAETVRLRDVRGLHYLRTLLMSPGQEIAASDLIAGGSGLRVPPGEPVLDAAGRRAYQRRLATLEEQLDAADRAGDVTRAQTLAQERTALVTELRTQSGTGVRSRRQSSEGERARVNATRALSTVLRRLETTAPLVAVHLRASLRTGSYFRYHPAPGGPRHWRV
ncbi:ATP-binding protein [Actinoplanes palleronii]|uniref:ATP-binding protein n=1 Tax=Actinoplanes palleronii TaxID=113570 RepID=UPI00194370FE|nr:ATP-binding protein [Actinoplanes palleronii]